MPSSSRLKKAELALRACALALPETYEEFPWGHRAMKVNKKAFAFLALEDGRLSMSVKLPESSLAALMLPFASPTGYGLGKSGWVTSAFGPREEVPLELLSEWIGESYRAIAPKKLADRAFGAGRKSGRSIPARKS
jgi:predicted DNA-binding protein (MmcQ/YjbR family)